MKKGLFRLGAVILVAVVLLAMAGVYAAADRPTVRIGFYLYSGLQEVDASGDYMGYNYDYLQEISKSTGWNYEFVVESFADCMVMLENGSIDFVGGLQKTPEREAKFQFPEYSCGSMFIGLYTQNDNESIAFGDFSAMQGMRVGVIRGFAANENLHEYSDKHSVSLVTIDYANEAELRSALAGGEVDAICLISLNAKESLRCIASFGYKDFYFMAGKDSPYVEDMSHAIENIKVQSPHYEQELSKIYYPTTNDKTPVFTNAEKQYISEVGTLNVGYNKSWIPLE